jgi:hypothetical protein
VFTKRIPHSVDFKIDGDEFELYAEVTRFIRRQCAAAAARGEETRARAVGFLMALYQRRLASSTYALRRSLENRVNRLTELLKKARDIAREAPAEMPSEEELEEMEEADRERGEHVPEAITLAGNPEQVRDESGELERLGGLAQAVEEIVREVRLAKLHSLLESAMREQREFRRLGRNRNEPELCGRDIWQARLYHRTKTVRRDPGKINQCRRHAGEGAWRVGGGTRLPSVFLPPPRFEAAVSWTKSHPLLRRGQRNAARMMWCISL